MHDTDAVMLTFNLTNVFFSLGLGIATALARKIKGNSWQKKQQYETYLLIQSIISTIILCFCEIVNVINMLVAKFDIPPPYVAEEPNLLFWDWAWRVQLSVSAIYIFSKVYSISSFVMLFIISKSVRESFLSFYFLDKILFWRKKKDKDTVTILTVSKTTAEN
uniref:Uncharacterized protein n=1 Tax=Panagrolaimus sp. ES5 TaxID=591445 RepID=A0AC34FSA6_9BILA